MIVDRRNVYHGTENGGMVASRIRGPQSFPSHTDSYSMLCLLKVYYSVSPSLLGISGAGLVWDLLGIF